MFGDDFSNDGTWEWLEEIRDKDPNVQTFRNKGPERKGIVYWYDFLCEKASNEIVMFFHADMYACPGMDTAVLDKLMKGSVVTATRIEPPLHPDGKEKILKDFGIEPESFDEQGLISWLNEDRPEKYTRGIFAPWAIHKEDYWKVGGHDILFAPQSKEDSDIFNRFHLIGLKFIQTWQGLVYHMTSRGSRFNPSSGGAPGKDSPEWIHTTTKNMRNFIRKWGTPVLHDEYMKPIVPPKYDIAFKALRCNKQMLYELEPWCSKIYLDFGSDYMGEYEREEQPNTQFDLGEKIKMYGNADVTKSHDILVEFDCTELNNENFQVLVNLSKMLQDSGEVGEMEFDIFKLYINSLQTYEDKLIICES
jgi:glycosyltransferase involved in cell wall biosynthesis